MSECDICAELADIKPILADHGDKLSILLTGVGTLLAAAPSAAYWNPADADPNIVLTNSDHTAESSANPANVRSVTSHASGTYYFEIVADKTGGGDFSIGLANGSYLLNTSFLGENTDGLGYYSDDGNFYENSIGTAYGGIVSFGETKVFGFAMDLTNKLAYVYIDGVVQNSGDPVGGTGGYAFSLSGPFFVAANPNPGCAMTLRTALADFSYTPPTGYQAWG